MSRPAHIAVFSVPAHGHVNPSLPLVRELVRRGHRVTYANGAAFAPMIAATGATPVVYASRLPRSTSADEWPQDVVAGRQLFLDEAIQALPQLRAAYASDAPDLVLHDITGWPARILAHEWGVPDVQLWPNLVPWDSYEEDNAEAIAAMRALPGYAEHERQFAAWLAEHGLGHMSVDDYVAVPEHGLVLIPRALQPFAHRVDARYRFVGPLIEPRETEDVWHPPDDGPVLLVSLGSAYTDQPALYREVLRAFGDTDWRVVVNIGRTVDPAALAPVPENIELHPFVPQLAVLDRAAAFVTHAGAGSSSEALWFGVPMVAIPQAVDQFGNADLLVSHGVARRLDRDEVTAEALREAVHHVAHDQHIRARADALRAEVRSEGGAGTAADAVEALLDRDDRAAPTAY